MGKIGILTFHWADDYGAMLQAYGLKSYLETTGNDVTIIPYSNSNLHGRYRFLPKHVGYKYRKLFIGDYDIWEMLRHVKHFRSFVTKRRNMRTFRCHFLGVKHSTDNINRLQPEKYDSIIIGSDQVWNPEITIGLDPIYTGNFTRSKTCKLIAYAASLGGDKLDEVSMVNLGRSISDEFDAVSLREQTAINSLSAYTDKSLVSVPDPSFLPDATLWYDTINNGVKNSHLPEHYIVLYRTEYNNGMDNYASELAKNKGLPIIDIHRKKYGPLEFLDAIAHADYVVTNSFHGTVFAIIYERKFIVFSHSNKNARLADLLAGLGLDLRLNNLHEIGDIDGEIDWESVHSKTAVIRQTGRKFLNSQIGE